MAYLIEHTLEKEKITVPSGDTRLLTDAKSPPNKKADDANTEISRRLKQQKQSLIHWLSEFPATAVWLLQKYLQQGIVDNQDDDITTALKSDLALCLNRIKADYQALVDNLGNPRSATAAKLKLSAALRGFPFSFDEITQLIDLIAYAYKFRELSYQPQKPIHKDLVWQRLEGLSKAKRSHKNAAIHFFTTSWATGATSRPYFYPPKPCLNCSL